MAPKTSFKSPSTPPDSRKVRGVMASSSSSTLNPSSSSNRELPSSPGMIDTTDIGDESDLMDLSTDLHKLRLNSTSIIDTPSPNKSKATTSTSKNSKSSRPRPSWGPNPASKTNPTLKDSRLLAGLDTSNSFTTSTSTAGGPRLGGMQTSKSGSRPRFSLFAKPNDSNNIINRSDRLDSALEEVEVDNEDSFLLETEKKDHQSNNKNNSQLNNHHHQEQNQTDPSQQESQEQVSNQLQELKRMNETFEQYEMGLLGVHAQMETFSDRIMSTSRLLDIYIDLLRQSERTQKLLLDPDWKGATEDESAHAEMLAQARRDEARARADAELAAAQAEEEARLEAERQREAEERRKLMESKGSTRGRGISSSRGTVRGGIATRGTARGASTTSRGASTATRGTTSATRSRTTSSIPARSTSGSGIARPSSATASSTTRGRTVSAGTTTSSTRGTVRSSGYGPK